MPKTAIVYVDGYVEPSFYDDPYYVHTSIKTVRESLQAQAPFDDIRVVINSGGGEVTEGFGIHDELISHGKPITTVVIGQCCSIATVIFLAGSTRLIAENAQFMVHMPWGGAFGNQDDIQEYLDLLKAFTAQLTDFYAEKTGLSDEELADLLQKDTYLTAEETIAKGFATALYQPVLAKAHITPTKQSGTGRPAPQPKATVKPASKIMSKQKNRLDKAIESIRAIFNGEPIKALSVTTVDGTALEIESTGDTYVVGDAVTVNGEPAPDGEHLLSDGNTITTENGVITAITVATEDGKEDEEPKASDEGETVTITKAEHDRLKSLDAQVTALNAKVAEHDKFQARVQAVLKGMESQDPVTPKLPETKAERNQPEAQPSAIERKQQRLAARK